MLQNKSAFARQTRPRKSIPDKGNSKCKISRQESSLGWYNRVALFCPRRVGDSDYSDGEEDFYYTEIKLNTDSVADGLSSLAPVSPSQSLASPPTYPIPDSSRTETPCAKTETKLMTPLSRSAPTTLYLVHTDHAYQVTGRGL